MIAAIYARKSTAQDGVADAERSVTRQEDLARAYASRQGWTVRHVFVDDGVSGAEFGKKRPGLQQMLAAAQRKAFGVLIVSEQKSIGREAVETGMVIKQLARAGVEVWGYMDARSLTPRNAMDKAMSSLRAFGDEVHREDTSRRGHEAHALKHRRGYVVGGRVFGYRNVHVYDGVDQHGNPRRSHTIREVDPAEAAVVQRIFELFAEGYGLKRIAKRLTAEGAPAPKPFIRKADFGLPPVGAWVPSTVRAVLRREDYRGVYMWNKTRKRDSDGAVDQRPRPEGEWQRAPMPEWRIVSDTLWNTVAPRCKEIEGRAVRFSDGRLAGRPPRGAVTNLLAGIATCGVCGGGLVVETYRTKAGTPRSPHYVCARRRANGACANALRMSLADMNESILAAIEEHALTPEAVEQVILLSERDDVTDRKHTLDHERKDIERRIKNLLAAIESGTDTPAALLERLKELQDRLSAITTELLNLRPVPRLAPAVIENRLAEWRRLLRGSVTQGRMVLERVLAGRMVFTPRTNPVSGRADGYDFTAPTRFDKLFTGIAVETPAWVKQYTDLSSLDGIGPEDTFDGDYGRLLERAMNRAKVASPPGFEPGFQP
jgi:site-specific DNA recombinase